MIKEKKLHRLTSERFIGRNCDTEKFTITPVFFKKLETRGATQGCFSGGMNWNVESSRSSFSANSYWFSLPFEVLVKTGLK